MFQIFHFAQRSGRAEPARRAKRFTLKKAMSRIEERGRKEQRDKIAKAGQEAVSSSKIAFLAALESFEAEKKLIDKRMAEVRQKLHGAAIPGRGKFDKPIEPVSIEPVVARAIEVIGDQEAAMRWLGTPVRALDYATPISRLSDPEGQTDVLKVLTQLEHGVL